MYSLAYRSHSLKPEPDVAVFEHQLEAGLNLEADTEACLLRGCDGHDHSVSEPFLGTWRHGEAREEQDISQWGRYVCVSWLSD